MRSLLASSVAVLAMTVSLAANAEDSVLEKESNHPISSPQTMGAIGYDTGASSYRVIGRMDGDTYGIEDVDYYRFAANTRSVEDRKIVFTGLKRAQVAVFVPVGGDLTKWEMIWDSGKPMANENRTISYIVPKTYSYFLVGAMNADVDGINTRGFTLDGGTYTVKGTNPQASDGDEYSMGVTGVVPDVKQVAIRIKPGVKTLGAPFNPNSKGIIPVAILSDATFDAISKVDTHSLTFGPFGTESGDPKCLPLSTSRDVNGDGFIDLVCHFSLEKAGFEPDDVNGVLKGKLKSGEQIEGSGVLKVVPSFRD